MSRQAGGDGLGRRSLTGFLLNAHHAQADDLGPG